MSLVDLNVFPQPVQILSVNGHAEETQTIECRRKGCECTFPLNKGIIVSLYDGKGGWISYLICSHACVMQLLVQPPKHFNH